MSGMPGYISWIGHGGVTLPPPLVFTGVTSYGFVLDASQAAMQALADALLAPATQGRLRYTVPAAAALATFFVAETARSIPQPIGRLPNRECHFWVPLLEHRPGEVLPRLVMWTPYVFIDNDIGLISGREAWGWPKTMARITVATDAPGAPARFACETLVLRRFGPTEPAVTAELFAIEGTEPIGTLPAGAAGLEELVSALFGEFGALVARALHLRPHLPCIALKQLPDAADPTRACFQAIVNSPCSLANMQGGAVLGDNFTLSVTPAASHAILPDIFGETPGAGPTRLPVRMAATMRFDMTVEAGSNVVAWP